MNDGVISMDDQKARIRQSDAAKNLTESQFDEGYSIAEIMARVIKKTGMFRDKLTGYAETLAKGERFDELKAEENVRGLFKERYGETMNQMRERLMAREREIEPDIDGEALRRAVTVVARIGEEPTVPFYQSYDQEAVAMADEHGITEAGAKTFMTTAFAAHKGRELYEAGKEAESLYHKPDRTEEGTTVRKSVLRSRRQYSQT